MQELGFIAFVAYSRHMISTKNPFPGMNPYLEKYWSDVHTTLITSIREALAPGLPRDLNARTEERVLVDDSDLPHSYRADVAVSETWKQGIAPAWSPAGQDQAVTMAEPEYVHIEFLNERWIEIRTAHGKLVTAIEVLSLANKRGDAHKRYRGKQSDYLAANVNLVEIDLVRAGEHTVRVPRARIPAPEGMTQYVICIHRATEPAQLEVYRWRLQQRIPMIRIPLRETDADVILDLQPLVDRAYELGRYWQENYAQELAPPLLTQEADWLDERLKSAGLR
jgi:hypothetical protein